MDDHKVLHHLLNVENEAAALVTDAQTEADRRLAEGERENRLRHDEAYSKEVEILESDYEASLASIKEKYRNLLDGYRVTLDNVSPDNKAFSSLAEKLLLGSALPDKDP